MSVIWGERIQAIKATTNPQTETVGYKLIGVDSPALVKALAAGYSPVLRGSLYRTNIAIDERGPALWDVDVTYGPYQQKEPTPNDNQWSASTTGGTKHITVALEHKNSYIPAGGKTATHDLAIGVTAERQVEGVDVLDPIGKWTENWKLLLADYAFTYMGTVMQLTGKTNASSFRGMAAGSVLFEGGEGTRSGKDPTILDITYHFAFSENRTGLTVGTITGIAKKGWEYSWVEYGVADKPGEGRPAMKAIQVNIERVYDEGDFSSLGIGTGSL